MQLVRLGIGFRAALSSLAKASPEILRVRSVRGKRDPGSPALAPDKKIILYKWRLSHRDSFQHQVRS